MYTHRLKTNRYDSKYCKGIRLIFFCTAGSWISWLSKFSTIATMEVVKSEHRSNSFPIHEPKTNIIYKAKNL